MTGIVFKNNGGLAPGVYDATVDAVEVVNGVYGLTIKWRLTVDTTPHPVRRTAYSDFGSTGKKSKTRRWVQAVLQRSVKDSEEIQPHALAGRACQVLVAQGRR